MTFINKEEAVLAWANENPYLTDTLIMGFLNENEGSCAIVPVSGEAVIGTYINGDKIKQYDFMFQVMFAVSENTDKVNEENMFTMRKWQEWIDLQEELGNYPDFGHKCSNYRLMNLANGPQLAEIFDNRYARYQFPARLVYEEER